MNLTVTPGYPLHGQADLPGDKSLSHRAALLAGMAQGESVIHNFLVSGVTQAMLGALTALGVAWELDGTTLRVAGKGLTAWKPPAAPIDCGNSATTLRLLAGALAAAGIPAVLDGSKGLRSRPMGRIVEPLSRMGVIIESGPGECAPIHLVERPGGRSLRAIDYTLPVASAQVKSCLLLAGLAADGETVLHEPGLSRDHTERMLAGLGVRVAAGQSPTTGEPSKSPADDTTQLAPPRASEPSQAQAVYTTRLTPPRAGEPSQAQAVYTTRLTPPGSLDLPPLDFYLPGDFSAAAFLIAGALITPGSAVQLNHVGLNPTRIGLLEALDAMGADIRLADQRESCGEPLGDLEIFHSTLHAGWVGGELVVRMIDEFPAFAAAAAFADGTSLVQDAGELRNKESDRISALCEGLRHLGVQAQEASGGFTIRGGSALIGGQSEAYGDHRLAMALALIGLASTNPVTVSGSEIIRESFPGFADTLAALGAHCSITMGT